MAPLGIRRPVTRIGLLLEVPDRHREEDGLFERLASLAEAAEDEGFDSLWVNDRMENSDTGSDDSSGLEAYSLLGALAARTSRVRLGALPRGRDRRAPSMLAKIVTGIDVISHGRSVATLGSALGSSARTGMPSVVPEIPEDSGSDTPPGHPPTDRLTEALRICRAVLDEQEIEFSGTFYNIHGALNRPRPVQVGGVPLALFVDDGYLLPTETLTAALGSVDAIVTGAGGTALGDVAEIVRAASPLHGRPADPVQVICLVPQPKQGSGSGTEITASYFEGLLSAGADGCILSVGIDTPPDSIRRAMLSFSAAMESMSLGHA